MLRHTMRFPIEQQAGGKFIQNQNQNLRSGRGSNWIKYFKLGEKNVFPQNMTLGKTMVIDDEASWKFNYNPDLVDR